MARNVESKHVEEDNGARTFKKVILALVAFCLLGIIYYFFELTPQVTKVTNLFVDINGDGLVDFIQSAKVIINTGSNINFP